MSVSIFRSTPLPIPLTLKSMEAILCQPSILSLERIPFTLVFTGEMDATAISIFGLPDQGVNYHPGTWLTIARFRKRIKVFGN